MNTNTTILLTSLVELILVTGFFVCVYFGKKYEREYYYGNYYHEIKSMYKFATFIGALIIFIFMIALKHLGSLHE